MPTLEEIRKEVNYWINEYNSPNALKDSRHLNFLRCRGTGELFPEIVEKKLDDENWWDLLDWREILNLNEEKHNDEDLYQREDGTCETYQETRQRVYQEFGELVKFFHQVLEAELERFERSYEVKSDGKIGTNEKPTNLEKIKTIAHSAHLTQYLCDTGFAVNPYPERVIYKINYHGAKQKVDKLMETLERLAWEVVGFTEPDEQKKLKDKRWVRNEPKRECFIQEKFVGQGKRYKGFDPLIFDEGQILHALILRGYQPSDLDVQGKYKGCNPLEKSKIDWDKILESSSKGDNVNQTLNPKKWPQGAIISFIFIVGAVVVAGFGFILKKPKKNAGE